MTTTSTFFLILFTTAFLTRIANHRTAAACRDETEERSR
jgi:hypothetical protein